MLNMKRRPHYAIVDTLLESFDVCDATRSHESRPTSRLRSQAGTRRAMRQTVICGLLFIAFVATVAIAGRPSTPPALSGISSR